jgi:biotin transport system substrate-specific component
MARTHETTKPEGARAIAASAHGAGAVAVRSTLLKSALVVAGVGVLAASAWISVPFYPVPITMQTLAVLLVGGLLGPRLGVAAVTSYLLLGLSGAPVFHNGLSGPAVLAGPTGGYLMGFVPAAYLMGIAARQGWASSTSKSGILSRVALLAGGALLAEVAIYALGLPWLAFTTVKSAEAAVTVGLIPFLLGDLVKTAVAVTAMYGGKNLLARWGSLPF